MKSELLTLPLPLPLPLPLTPTPTPNPTPDQALAQLKATLATRLKEYYTYPKDT